jgi:hypothetical protein
MMKNKPKAAVNFDETSNIAFWEASFNAALTGAMAGLRMGALEATRLASNCADLALSARTEYWTEPAPPVPYLVPTNLNAAAAGGGSNSFEVNTDGSTTEWTATSADPWIVVNSPTTAETGDGSVTFTVSPNVTVARTGQISISGLNLVFTVNQAAASVAVAA